MVISLIINFIRFKVNLFFCSTRFKWDKSCIERLIANYIIIRRSKNNALPRQNHYQLSLSGVTLKLAYLTSQ